MKYTYVPDSRPILHQSRISSFNESRCRKPRFSRRLLTSREHGLSRIRVFCRRAVRKSRRTTLPPFSDLCLPDSWLDHEGRARVSPVECRRNEVFHPPVPSSVSPPRRPTKPGAQRQISRPSSGSCPEVIPSSGNRQGRTFKLGRESRGIHERNGAAGIP